MPLSATETNNRRLRKCVVADIWHILGDLFFSFIPHWDSGIHTYTTTLSYDLHWSNYTHSPQQFLISERLKSPFSGAGMWEHEGSGQWGEKFIPSQFFIVNYSQ